MFELSRFAAAFFGCVLVSSTLLALSGCATAPPGGAVGSTSEVRVTDDPFRPFRELATPPLRSMVGGDIGIKQLVARVDRKTGALALLVQFEIGYSGLGKRDYERARNDRAEPLAVSVVQSSGRCQPGATCVYTEKLLITLAEQDVRARDGDYQVKIFARNGPDALITIPKAMSAALLAEVDAARGRAAKPT